MKHAAESKFPKKTVFILIIIVIAIILGFLIFRNNIYNYSGNIVKNSIVEDNKSNNNNNNNSQQQLILKSKGNTFKEEEIIYKFDDNGKIQEIKITERYNEKEKYEYYKDEINKRADIKDIKTSDDEMTITYNKKDFGMDANLNYNKIKEKYLSIAGAYEVVE